MADYIADKLSFFTFGWLGSITVCDVVLFALLAVAVLYGYDRGVIRVCGSVGSVFIGYYAARVYSTKVAIYVSNEFSLLPAAPPEDSTLYALSLLIDTDAAVNRLVQIAAFIIIFFVTIWLVRALSKLISDTVEHGFIGKLNTLLGMVAAALVLTAALIVVEAVILPACVQLGFGQSALDFLHSSNYVLPFLYDIPMPL